MYFSSLIHEMPLLCAKCDMDVTIAYFAAPPHVPFRCRCGSAEFVDQPVMPEFTLTENDKKLIAKHEALVTKLRRNKGAR